MKRSGSIRTLLSLQSAAIVAVGGLLLTAIGHGRMERRLEGQAREFAIHETMEIRAFFTQAEPAAATPERLGDFPSIFPEKGVIALELRSAEGELLDRAGPPSGEPPAPWSEGIARALAGETPCERIPVPGEPEGLRAALAFRETPDGPMRVAVAVVSRDEVVHTLVGFLQSSLLVTAIATIVVFLGSGWLVRRAFRPVQAMVDDARTIAERGPEQRLALPPPGSELHSLARFLNRMLERAESDLARMSRFTAFAGHELRTPLTRIRGESELALASGDPDRLRRALESVLEEVRSLSNLIEELLLLSRGAAEGGGAWVETDLVPLVESLVDECRALAELRSIRVVHESTLASARAPANRELLARAIWNVLRNAVQYSPEGSEVAVRVGGDGRAIRVEVLDRGPGVPDAEIEEIFEPFRRGSSAGKSPGLGLGLAISRSIIQRHGGTIEAERRTGGGLAMRIAIPLAAGAPAGPPPAATVAAISDPARRPAAVTPAGRTPAG